MKMFSCFGIRTRPSQPALAKDQSVVSINKVPAAGEGCHLRSCRLSPVGKEAEGSGALVRAAWRGAYGAAGKSREDGVTMHDTVSMRPSFCTWVDGSRMHFFAVFDGHGGPVVSALLRDQMHAILAEELTRAAAAYRKKQHQNEEAELCAWKGALRQSFARADELAASAVPRGTIMGSTAVVALVVGGRILVANCGDSRAVLCRAGRAVPLSQDHKQKNKCFSHSNNLARSSMPTFLSSNATFLSSAATLLSSAANLLSSAAASWFLAIFLTSLASFLAFTIASIAFVSSSSPFLFFFSVFSFLHPSGRFGHTLINPEITCEPDITITARSDDDDCLILASNGLWDVISNQKACCVASKCLENKSKNVNVPAGKEQEVRCVCAAIRLTNLAINEHSLGDISVVVLDLKVRG
ncbi:putative protein phosphatase 2C 37 [Hordeum vulgare]|nr:putative protein phosphatase 2C 37 [Hordeum vulgare]